MKRPIHRRHFLQTSAVLGAGVWLGTSPQARAAANDKLNLAVIGLANQGGVNLGAVSGNENNIVALCDVDDVHAAKAYDKHPNVKKFYDYRQMFDELHASIDAVVISTPDHTHFHPARMAMSLGKHIYLEKPMAHSVWEARELTKLAAEKKLATQLGVQRHVLPSIHKSVEYIRAGAIGPVKEVHAWIGSNRGMPKDPTDFPAVPATLKWDLWIGPAPETKYTPDICPYKWRFWWDYGTGEAGNWGCHILDIAYWALNLTYPTKVGVDNPSPDPKKTPTAFHSWFEFPAAGNRPGLTLHWYQGRPPIMEKLGIKGSGDLNTLFVGEKGLLTGGFTTNAVKLYSPDAKSELEFTLPAETIEKSSGFHKEWIAACRGGKPATCDFSYSGPMAETVLLANAAYRAGGGFDWDAAALKAKGNPKADDYLVPHFRKGWEV